MWNWACFFHRILFFSLILSSFFVFSGCEALKGSKPILPVREYETMIVGRFDADYVGTSNCLAACHAHDRLKRFFDASTMGAQLKQESGLPLVDCESCHGPGSLAVKGLTQELVETNARKGIKTKCDYKTLIDLKNLPTPAQSLICLKCHSANATFNLHNWNVSSHALNEVSCFNCHTVHKSPDLKVTPRDTARLCFTCHQAVQAEFSLPSHHPVNEGRAFCIDCHDSHGGSAGPMLLRKDTVKETCVECHPEKRGPYLYEHADVIDNCMNCHTPHGSVNNNLLIAREPFLCLQCHEGHRIAPPGSSPTLSATARAFYSKCTDCHSQVHGSDVPSSSGKGRLTQ